jgi:hypothetical protein
MVELIPKVVDGKRVWAEVAPELCGNDHDQLIPGWGPCPTCGQMLRRWTCLLRPSAESLPVLGAG